ncbi:MAG: phosphotransferase [Actinobacteria bacterium]|nr:phosphotransferase [Actinomycetota bacterium]
MAAVIVSGMVAGTPAHGGATWSILQYLLGLRELGHEVWLVEPVEGDDQSFHTSARWCSEVMERFDLADCWCLVRPHRAQTAGMGREELRRVASRVDLLLNASGLLADADVLDAVPTRVYLDLDPGFAQLWHAADGIDMRFDAHTHFVTVGDAVGTTIPDCGRTWLSTLPPVVLRHWPYADRLEHEALTTVANWRSYGSTQHDGLHYGQKVHSWRALIDVPTRTDVQFLVALGIHPDEVADLEALHRNRWQLVDPLSVAATPEDYRRFVQGSWGELGIAKSGYVVSRSGWFSDRSACYLASGRPVVAQDTGFGRRLPVGEGLLAFRRAEDVAGACERLRADYGRHRQAARAIAEQHLDSRRVLTTLLDRVLGREDPASETGAAVASSGPDRHNAVVLSLASPSPAGQRRPPPGPVDAPDGVPATLHAHAGEVGYEPGSPSDDEIVAALVDRLGHDDVRLLERQAYRYATSFRLEDVEVEVGGTRLRIIVKHLAWRNLLPDARRTKPPFLHEPLRAIETYRRILAREGIGARLYAVVADRERDRYWIAVEKVPGVELWQVADREIWAEVARWLARFHARFQPRVGALRRLNPYLLEYGRTAFAFWAQRAHRALIAGDHPRRRELLPLLDGYHVVVDALVDLPVTLVHGEFYPSNIIVTKRPDQRRVCPVDWEMSALGPGVLDLAALSTGWSDEDRTALAAAYHQALPDQGAGPRPPWERFVTDLDRARLHLALQWIGWADEWRPPPEHAHDWIVEAVTVTERLRL